MYVKCSEPIAKKCGSEKEKCFHRFIHEETPNCFPRKMGDLRMEGACDDCVPATDEDLVVARMKGEI